LYTDFQDDEPVLKLHDDPRVTRIGRFLRRWSLDELPQFWNVIRGEMSVVGPRPLQYSEVSAFPNWHEGRTDVRPGITGLWQVSGRSDLSLDERIQLDFFYVDNWSLSYDLYILLKTLPAVASRRGSY
jgi:lipopolysaccharide/colanic/teichoic acid biosynthesis glycosyltransferase